MLVFQYGIGYSRALLVVPLKLGERLISARNHKATTGGCNMVEVIGFRILVPLFVFGIIIVGAYLISDAAFQDVLRRRREEERS